MPPWSTVTAMPDNLPAVTAPPPSLGLAEVPSPALVFALGHTTAKPSKINGERIVALAAELLRRGEWDALVASLEPSMAASLGVVLRMSYAQRHGGAR